MSKIHDAAAMLALLFYLMSAVICWLSAVFFLFLFTFFMEAVEYLDTKGTSDFDIRSGMSITTRNLARQFELGEDE